MINSLADYRQKMTDENWVPGWDAISDQFAKLYPGVNPPHYGTTITSRARLGGDCYLDGYSLYPSLNGYQHIVTYGMTALYADPEAFGQEYSGWGYEMTLKLKAHENPEDCKWALDMLSNLARYTCTSKRWFKPYQYVGGNGASINRDKPTLKITALLIVPDTEMQGLDTVHGRVDFLQLVGLTTRELDVIMADGEKIKDLTAALAADYPYLETDMARARDYL